MLYTPVIHIVCLQETDSVEGDEKTWRAEWGSELFLSHGQSANQGGVAVMMPSRFGGKAKVASALQSGRIVSFKIRMVGRTMLCCRGICT